jgi:pyruvate dehydrogenase E2 component (dihydrolipoyllysine-residue acetyltransferase)
MDGRLVEQTRMRAGIGRRMRESKQEVPHFYVQTEVATDALAASLDDLNAAEPPVRVTVTAALALACVHALRAHPRFNSRWTPDGLMEVDDVNLGVAVALDDGLLAPALLAAGELGIVELAAAMGDLAQRTRTQKLRPRELSDATFTLSNLGMFDVSAFTAIITPPQVATLATARPVERCRLVGGIPVASSTMTVTLSADHRAVDGADAARWLETFKTLVEAPQSLLSEPVQTKEATR